MKNAFLALVSWFAFVACASSQTFDEALDLPPSTATRNVDPGLVVTVTKRTILVDGQPVATIAAGKVSPSLKSDGENGYRITPLVEALEKRAASGRAAAKAAGRAFDGRVTLGVDGSLSYGLFSEVLFSCGQGGYARYDLIVQKAPGASLAAINIVIPDVSAHNTPEPTVWVTPNGFKVAIDGEWSEVPKLANGRYDYERIRTMLSGHPGSAGGDAEHGHANVGGYDSIPYAVIVATMDAMRVTQDRTPLFPVIAFVTTTRK